MSHCVHSDVLSVMPGTHTLLAFAGVIPNPKTLDWESAASRCRHLTNDFLSPKPLNSQSPETEGEFQIQSDPKSQILRDLPAFRLAFQEQLELQRAGLKRRRVQKDSGEAKPGKCSFLQVRIPILSRSIEHASRQASCWCRACLSVEAQSSRLLPCREMDESSVNHLAAAHTLCCPA